jgi:C4-dicarboxylate-binding protein DctP
MAPRVRRRDGGRTRVARIGIRGYAVVMNEAFWDKLPPDPQAVVASSSKDATDCELAQVARENEWALARNEAMPVVAVTGALGQCKKGMGSVHKEMEPRVGAGLLRDVYKAAGSNPS